MPDNPTPYREEIPVGPDHLLLSAAQRVLIDSFDGDSVAGNWTSAADELASLTMAVQTAIATGEPGIRERPSSQLRQLLLDRLEAEILSEQGRGNLADVHSLERVLEALEQVRSALLLDPDDLVKVPFSGPRGSELVAEIAHDLRSPLTSILTLAETLQRGQSGEVNDVQRRQLGLIYSAALALSSTASDLIELAHGGDSLAQKERSPFSVTDMLESVHDIVYPLAEEKGLGLQHSVGISEWRLGYPLALSRVLLNLTTNALKFTDEGFVEIAVSATNPNEVEFSVRDTGKGLDSDSLATLYQPFRRMSGRQGYCFSGTGLGLVICRRLVEALGSSLEIETEKGWGTRFHFRIKLPPAEPPV